MAPRVWISGSHEVFPPSVLLEQAVAAARAGFEGIGCSDHFAPWFPDGQSGNAWVWLGAAGSEQEAIAGARRWKATQLPELYREDIHDPQEMQRLADERL